VSIEWQVGGRIRRKRKELTDGHTKSSTILTETAPTSQVEEQIRKITTYFKRTKKYIISKVNIVLGHTFFSHFQLSIPLTDTRLHW
jgi:hypothetical protein